MLGAKGTSIKKKDHPQGEAVWFLICFYPSSERPCSNVLSCCMKGLLLVRRVSGKGLFKLYVGLGHKVDFLPLVALPDSVSKRLSSAIFSSKKQL